LKVSTTTPVNSEEGPLKVPDEVCPMTEKTFEEAFQSFGEALSKEQLEHLNNFITWDSLP